MNHSADGPGDGQARTVWLQTAWAAPDSVAKREALERMADMLEQERPHIAAANAKDLQAAAEKGLSGAKLDRLRLSDKVLAK